MLVLNDDILSIIFNLLDDKDWLNLRLTCRRLDQVPTRFEKIMRELNYYKEMAFRKKNCKGCYNCHKCICDDEPYKCEGCGKIGCRYCIKECRKCPSKKCNFIKNIEEFYNIRGRKLTKCLSYYCQECIGTTKSDECRKCQNIYIRCNKCPKTVLCSTCGACQLCILRGRRSYLMDDIDMENFDYGHYTYCDGCSYISRIYSCDDYDSDDS